MRIITPYGNIPACPPSLQNRGKLAVLRRSVSVRNRPRASNFCQRVTLLKRNTTVFSFHNHSTPSFEMASRTFSRALRSPLAKQLRAPAHRTFVSALNASARPTAARAVAAAQQVRGVKTIDFAGTKEDVYGKN